MWRTKGSACSVHVWTCWSSPELTCIQSAAMTAATSIYAVKGSNTLPLHEGVKEETNVGLYESLTHSEVRLLTNKEFQDTIGIGYKLVEDVDLTMQVLSYFSRQQCFTNYCDRPKPKARKHSRKQDVLVERLPSWFNPKLGSTLGQWIAAFLEMVLLSKYLATNIDKTHTLDEIAEPYRKLLKDNKNLICFWRVMKEEDRLSCIEELMRSEESRGLMQMGKEVEKTFICCAIASADAVRFIESCYCMRLNISCTPLAELCKQLMGIISERHRKYILDSLERDSALYEVAESKSSTGCLEHFRVDKLIRGTEYYKAFFELDYFDVSHLSVEATSLKRPKKARRKKHKKKVTEASTIDSNIQEEEMKEVPKCNETSNIISANEDIPNNEDNPPTVNTEPEPVKSPPQAKKCKTKKQTKGERKREQEKAKRIMADYKSIQKLAVKKFEEIALTTQTFEKDSKSPVAVEDNPIKQSKSPDSSKLEEEIKDTIAKPMIVLEPYYCYPKESEFFTALNKEIDCFVSNAIEYVTRIQPLSKLISRHIEQIARHAFSRTVDCA
eukprot:TRINITY_DN15973_c0_g2_i2.p1 TRINITY_DN15973_c0_g2~~TRINITY_DN15973_c0_g2_i2.p1  ORF type:complete len:555 (+),score=91.78 TRINITY_DN15973_c0_g2_i2:401-2065(+)